MALDEEDLTFLRNIDTLMNEETQNPTLCTTPSPLRTPPKPVDIHKHEESPKVETIIPEAFPFPGYGPNANVLLNKVYQYCEINEKQQHILYENIQPRICTAKVKRLYAQHPHKLFEKAPCTCLGKPPNYYTVVQKHLKVIRVRTPINDPVPIRWCEQIYLPPDNEVTPIEIESTDSQMISIHGSTSTSSSDHHHSKMRHSCSLPQPNSS